MKTIIAIFKPFRLPSVLRAVAEVSPRGVSYSEVRGYGRQKGHLDAYEGSEIAVEFVPKIRLEMTVDDLFVEEALRCIRRGARTGRIGDGKVFVLPSSNPFEPSPSAAEESS